MTGEFSVLKECSQTCGMSDCKVSSIDNIIPINTFFSRQGTIRLFQEASTVFKRRWAISSHAITCTSTEKCVVYISARNLQLRYFKLVDSRRVKEKSPCERKLFWQRRNLKPTINRVVDWTLGKPTVGGVDRVGATRSHWRRPRRTTWCWCAPPTSSWQCLAVRTSWDRTVVGSRCETWTTSSCIGWDWRPSWGRPWCGRNWPARNNTPDSLVVPNRRWWSAAGTEEGKWKSSPLLLPALQLLACANQTHRKKFICKLRCGIELPIT